MRQQASVWSARVMGVSLAATGLLVAVVPAAPAHAAGSFAVGIPTVVDPIRAMGEPDIGIDNGNNAWITGPGGSGTQTSFFFHSLDGGLSYKHDAPASSGHWICPASGGGDSLAILDPASPTNDAYLTDQEALADLGFLKANGLTGVQEGSGACAAAPAVSADRPFLGVLHPTDPVPANQAPQYRADGSKPMVYLSWLCAGCNMGNGGLAFGWTDDGTTFHIADPGVPDNPALATVTGGSAIGSFGGHGPTLVDPKSGYVYTAVSCSGSCPNGSTKNEFGIAVGKPDPNPANPAANKGQFASLDYHTAADQFGGGAPFQMGGSLFPVIARDAAGTLYEMWIEGDGAATTSTPLIPEAWHLYYSFSKAAPDYATGTWSAPIRVDTGADTATTDFGWVAAGDAGKLAFAWLGTDKREHPSFQDAAKVWHAHMAITTNGDTIAPSFQQTTIGIGPNHISDMCLQGTVGCITSIGNRNMADFISVDIGPNGAAQMTWANDANRLATQPTTLIPGAPLTETATQVSGPRLRGGGLVNDSRFSATPTAGVTDAAGDGTDPRNLAAPNVPQMDLLGSSVITDGTNVNVHIPVASLADTTSPDSGQPNVWWLTTWQFGSKIYFAKAESNSGGAPTFTAGAAKSFDRPGLNAQTVATLIDYQGGTAVTGAKQGNEWVIQVPPSLVGSPTTNSVLESVTAYSVIDNGQPLTVAPGPTQGPQNNIPTIFDATPAYNAGLGSLPAVGSSTPLPSPTTSVARMPPERLALALILVMAGVLVAGVGFRLQKKAG